MITVNAPIEIKTDLGTVIIRVNYGEQITIEVYQRNGKAVYRLDTDLLDGKLREERFD